MASWPLGCKAAVPPGLPGTSSTPRPAHLLRREPAACARSRRVIMPRAWLLSSTTTMCLGEGRKERRGGTKAGQESRAGHARLVSRAGVAFDWQDLGGITADRGAGSGTSTSISSSRRQWAGHPRPPEGQADKHGVHADGRSVQADSHGRPVEERAEVDVGCDGLQANGEGGKGAHS